MHTHNHSKGFTLVELMIVLAIIAIVASMAIPSYLDYQVRAKVGSSLALASAVKLGVSESYAYNAQMPLNNAEAGLPSASSINSSYVSSIAIGSLPSPGSIVITFRQFSRVKSGDSLLLEPFMQGGSVTWDCSSSTLKSSYVPSVCR